MLLNGPQFWTKHIENLKSKKWRKVKKNKLVKIHSRMMFGVQTLGHNLLSIGYGPYEMVHLSC